MTETLRITVAAAVGAVASFLTRPCCVIPVALSAAGFTSAGVAHAAILNRPAFLGASVAMLAASVWMTFRREGGWPAKAISAGATILAFVFFGSF